jgi:hypothetical protein
MKLVGAGLEIACERNISDERLFENLMRLWEHYGSATARMKARGVPFLMWTRGVQIVKRPSVASTSVQIASR